MAGSVAGVPTGYVLGIIAGIWFQYLGLTTSKYLEDSIL